MFEFLRAEQAGEQQSEAASVDATPAPEAAATALDAGAVGGSADPARVAETFAHYADEPAVGASAVPGGEDTDRREDESIGAPLDLAKKLAVVGDDFVGPLLPNEVTKEEYAKVQQTLDNVREGKGDLRLSFGGADSGRQRGAALATSESIVTAAGCAWAAKVRSASGAYAAGISASMRDPALLAKRVLGP
jgi:hypothetical protein